MEQFNIFTSGIDKDSPSLHLQQGKYRYMLNGDIYKDENNSKGVAVNSNGNTLMSVVWPTDVTSTADASSPYNNNWVISKGINDKDDIILIYKDTNNTGNIKIDLLKYGDISYTRIVLIDDKYAGILSNGIVDAFVNREKDDLVKLYFYSKGEGGNTKLKHLNIAPDFTNEVSEDPLLQGSYTRINSLTSEDLDIMPSQTYIPFRTASYIGGNLRVGVYIYYIRGYENGGYTEWVQLTGLTPISSTINNSTTNKVFGEYSTNDTGYINTTVGLSIPSAKMATNCQVLRVWFSELNGTGEASIIYEGSGTSLLQDVKYDSILSTVDIGELNLLKPFISPKTHAIKDNTLFLANLEEDYFDIDFDARAYRFNSSGQAVLTNSDGNVYIDSTDVNWKDNIDFDLTDDLVNPFNTNYASGYKFNQAGVLGGEGKNVSYSFLLRSITVGDTESLLNGTDSTLLTQFCQFDEIYRVAVVVHDKYLRRSSAKWIGDIRTPRHDEMSASNDTDEIKAFGLILAVDINVTDYPELYDSYFSLAVVKRDFTDRRILYEGVAVGAATYDQVNAGNSYLTSTTTTKVPSNPTAGGTIYNGEGLSGSDKIDTRLYFYSPEISVFKNSKVTGLKIELIGKLSNIGANEYFNPTGDFFNALALSYPSSFGAYAKYPHFEPIEYDSDNIKDIIDSETIEPGNQVSIDGDLFLNKVHDFVWTSSDSSSGFTVQGDGATAIGIKCDSLTNAMALLDSTHLGYFAIKRDVYPYGGGSYQSRLSSIYVLQGTPRKPAKIYIPELNYIAETGYTGDVFPNLFELQRVINPYSALTSNAKYAELIAFPVASTVNTNLFVGKNPTESTLNTIPGEFREEGNYLKDDGTEVDYPPLYKYNSVYSQTDTGSYAVEKDYSNNQLEKFPTKVAYSDTKVNGETLDSFLSFRVNNFNSAENRLGPVNHMIEKNGNVYVFQDSGMSLARINTRTQIPQDDGTTALMGISTVLDGFTYISDNVGIQKLNEALTSNSYIYFMDINKKKIYRYSSSLEPISDLMGIASHAKKTIDLNTTLIGGYDSITSNMLLTIRNEANGYLYDDIYFDVGSIIGYTYIYGDSSKLLMNIGNIYTLSGEGQSGEYLLYEIFEGGVAFTYVSGYTFGSGDSINMSKYIEEPDSYTLKINEPINAVISYMSFIPSIYIKRFKQFVLSGDSRSLYEYDKVNTNKGEFFGVVYPFVVSYEVGNELPINKQLDALSIHNKIYRYGIDTFNKFSYLEASNISNKTISEITSYGDRARTEHIPIYVKNAEVPTEYTTIDTVKVYTDDIDDVVFTESNRTIYEAEGVKILPYKDYLFNTRNSLNSFNLAMPRLKTGQLDEGGRLVTERIRGKQLVVKLIYDNSIAVDEIRIYNTRTFYSTSTEL